tara:strand:+ start:141 stop:527 length:387 start_codon:yes stop_codon:yes gene_type:complete
MGFHLDIKEIPCGLEQYDIMFLPHWRIEELPVNSADLFLNTCSISEINMNAALHYLSIIKKTVRDGGYFYTYNVFHDDRRNEQRVDYGIEHLIKHSKFDLFKLVSSSKLDLLKLEKHKTMILQKTNTD